jgi:hypothetical protein
MPEFDSATPRFKLPLLFAGQAQKEFYVNEAHALADALLHCAVEGESAVPPTTPAEGECWLVAAGGSGAWAGRDGMIASRTAGNWLFTAPRDGLALLDRATGQQIRFATTWRRPEVPLAPIGGVTVDGEARATIAALIEALAVAGIFPET